VKDWRTEWFYVGNMDPPLIVHSDVGPVLNDRWEKTPLTSEELQKIKPFLDRIKTLKQQGLTDFGIVASYLRRRVQPLKVRETVNGEPYGPPHRPYYREVGLGNKAHSPIIKKNMEQSNEQD